MKPSSALWKCRTCGGTAGRVTADPFTHEEGVLCDACHPEPPPMPQRPCHRCRQAAWTLREQRMLGLRSQAWLCGVCYAA